MTCEDVIQWSESDSAFFFTFIPKSLVLKIKAAFMSINLVQAFTLMLAGHGLGGKGFIDWQ